MKFILRIPARVKVAGGELMTTMKVNSYVDGWFIKFRFRLLRKRLIVANNSGIYNGFCFFPLIQLLVQFSPYVLGQSKLSELDPTRKKRIVLKKKKKA